jgi:hypothetical protein
MFALLYNQTLKNRMMIDEESIRLRSLIGGSKIIIDGNEVIVIFKSKSFVFDINGYPIKIRAVIDNLELNEEQVIECNIIYDESGYVSDVSEWTVV